MKVTVILEANGYQFAGNSTLWVVPGGYDHNDATTPRYDELPKAVKLIGPIKSEDCRDAYKRLLGALKSLRLEVDTLETRDDGKWLDQSARGLWRYVEDVLSTPALLLQDSGFTDRNEVSEVVVVLEIGDQLHPNQGVGYFAPDWESLAEDVFFRKLNRRDNQVRKIYRKVMKALQDEGYRAACRIAVASSKYQVVYLSRSEKETRDQLYALAASGVEPTEYGEDTVQRGAGNRLIFGFKENCSSFIKTWS